MAQPGGGELILMPWAGSECSNKSLVSLVIISITASPALRFLTAASCLMEAAVRCRWILLRTPSHSAPPITTACKTSAPAARFRRWRARAPVLAQYAGPKHSVLYMVPNRGFTLDLAAIRRLHPGSTVKSFHCLVSTIFPGIPTPARAELDIIVDGGSRFQRTFGNQDGAFSIEATLHPDDRFLTIALTQVGRDQAAGTMFADASLETSK